MEEPPAINPADTPAAPMTPPPAVQVDGPRDAPDWLKAAVGVPIIWVWLILAGAIVHGAITDPTVLESIEGLLTALAVLTIPAMEIIRMIFRRGRE